MGADEDFASCHSIHTFKPSTSFSRNCPTARFGAQTEISVKLRSVDTSKDTESNTPAKKLEEVLCRWQPAVVADLNEPVSQISGKMKCHIPDEEDMGVRLGGDTQLRLMFGNLLSDLVLACGDAAQLPKDVSPCLVLPKPFRIEITEFEKKHIKEMKRHLKAQNIRLYGTAFEDGRYLLRFLQGNRWSYEKTLEDMLRHMEWRCATHPIRYASVAPAMSSGFVYIHGRDRKHRPIIVFKTKHMKDVPEVSSNSFTKRICAQGL
eukprot:Selendium_serpulae@DN5804_c0_g1_i7.p2